MKKIIFTVLALLSTMSISAQTIEVYKYNADGSLSSIPAFSTTDKVKVIFKDNKVEGTTTINGTTYTKAVGGTVAGYVDLGIVVDGKKVLWATHNLGASKPEEYGAYIAWGENGTAEEGYSEGIKTTGYKLATYKYYTSSSKYTKYVCNDDYGTIDDISALESEDDAATVNWGSDWRTPTDDEFAALINTCTWTWFGNDNIVYNGVEGFKVEGTNGKSIFLPAAGHRSATSYTNHDSAGSLYWSNSGTNDSGSGIDFGLIEGGSYGESGTRRMLGCTVRPVRSE